MMLNIFLFGILYIKFIAINAQECVKDPVPISDDDDEMGRGAIDWVEVDSIVEQNAFNAIQIWNQRNAKNNGRFFTVTCIKNVQRQVVAGIIYKMNVTLKETNCEQSSINSSDDLIKCKIIDPNASLDCIFELSILVYNGTQTDLVSNCTEKYSKNTTNVLINTPPALPTTKTTTKTTKSFLQMSRELIKNLFLQFFKDPK